MSDQLHLLGGPSPNAAAPKRLPQEERDLRRLAQTGYWFCSGCSQVTHRTAWEECELCGSMDVQWCEPVFAT